MTRGTARWAGPEGTLPSSDSRRHRACVSLDDFIVGDRMGGRVRKKVLLLHEAPVTSQHRGFWMEGQVAIGWQSGRVHERPALAYLAVPDIVDGDKVGTRAALARAEA